MSEIKITNEVNQLFLRRTRVKLRQFSRLLNDMVMKAIDPLRVKALLSQVNKTREACLSQEFDSTARLLNQLLNLLALSERQLETQKPLLIRLSGKLQEHSEKLELGVKPNKILTIVSEATALTKNKEQEAFEASEAEEMPVDVQITDKLSEAEHSIVLEESSIKEETTLDESVLLEENAPLESALEEKVVEETEEENSYLNGHSLIFVSQSGERYESLLLQFDSIGVDVKFVLSMAEAKQLAENDSTAIIIAPLKFAQSNQQLEDEDIETSRIPLIYTGKEDSQDERLLALRSGGTGYLVEPVSMTKMLDYLERQFDIHIDFPYKILVMEDSKAQARYYEKILAKGHFNVRIVNDPRVLLEALRSFEPETLLMDMQMPTCSGIELTRIIRQMPRYANLPIIFLSAEESISKQNQALMSGGTSFIVKPVKKEQLSFMADLYARRYRELTPQININPDSNISYSIPFKQKISVEATRASRNANNIALAILQIDQTEQLIKESRFSTINQALHQLAVLLKRRLRKTDILGHLETGQVGVILTTGGKKEWTAVMDRVRLQFAELFQQEDERFTLSTGLSLLALNWDAHQWVDSCTQQLKKALDEGGDRTLLADE